MKVLVCLKAQIRFFLESVEGISDINGWIWPDVKLIKGFIPVLNANTFLTTLKALGCSQDQILDF